VMSLILAIEPNKNQAHQLSALVRAHLKAELVTAPTAAAALAALGDRIPDVVLTPALFGLRDEAALTERLRQLGSDGSHVQTLAIPILAAPSRAAGPNGGLLNRKKEKGDAEVGCDPAVFAEQIRIYLQRAAVERRAQASEAAARSMTATPPASAGGAPEEDLSAFMVSADELDVDTLELATIPPPAAPEPAPAPTAKATAAAREQSPEPTAEDVRRGKAKQPPRPPSAGEADLGLVTPPTAGPPLWKVSESVEDFYGNPEAAATTGAISTPDMMVEPMAAPSKPVTQNVAPPAQRKRRTPPQPDDWSYFDPSQNAFKALIRRLDEIAGSAA
jgi:CheY-like chemotaxis protein